MHQAQINTQQRHIINITLRRILTLCLKFNGWMAALCTVFAVYLTIAIGATIDPDFWQARSLVNLWGNGWMFLAVSYVAFLPFGLSPYWLAGAVQAGRAIGSLHQIVAQLPKVRDLLDNLLQLIVHTPAAIAARHALIFNRLLATQPQQKPKSQAPIRLIGRAALLLGP